MQVLESLVSRGVVHLFASVDHLNAAHLFSIEQVELGVGAQQKRESRSSTPSRYPHSDPTHQNMIKPTCRSSPYPHVSLFLVGPRPLTPARTSSHPNPEPKPTLGPNPYTCNPSTPQPRNPNPLQNLVFRWVWHDATTFSPYLLEIPRIAAQKHELPELPQQNGGIIYVLRSLTRRHIDVLNFLAQHQLDQIAAKVNPPRAFFLWSWCGRKGLGWVATVSGRAVA